MILNIEFKISFYIGNFLSYKRNKNALFSMKRFVTFFDHLEGFYLYFHNFFLVIM